MSLSTHIRRALAAAVPAALGAAILASPAHASTTAPSIKYGSRGQGVVCVQGALELFGFKNVAPDGVDGTITTNAVIQFQKDMHLVADGVVGPLTGSALLNYEVSIGYGFDAYPCYTYVPTSR